MMKFFGEMVEFLVWHLHSCISLNMCGAECFSAVIDIMSQMLLI